MHIEVIRLGLQPIFMAEKNVTCLLALLDTRCNTFGEALITMVEAGLNNGHVTLLAKPNFTLGLTKANIADIIQVMIHLYGTNMNLGETALAFHHTMTYKIQSHVFSMDHDLIPKIHVMGDAKTQQPKYYKRDQLTFPTS